jgi:hypothetical protein
MSLSRRAFASLLLIAACSSGADDPSLVTEGSRLQVLHRTAEGKELVSGFYDRSLGVRCRLVELPDDRVACLPEDLHYRSPYFTDEGCTVAVDVVLGTACAPPAYAYEPVPGTCPGGRKIYRTGPPIDPKTPIFTRNVSGTCGRIYFQSPDPHFVVPLVEEVPLSAFVMGHRREAPGPGRLGAVWDEMEDGARQLRQLHDAMLGVRCDLGPSADGSVRCLPASRASSAPNVFSDDECKMAAEWIDPSCSLPPYVRRFMRGACPRRTAIHRSGAVVESVYFENSNCSMVRILSAERPATLFALGEEVAPALLAAGSLEPGTGRLLPIRYRSEEGLQRATGVTDQQLGVECEAGVAGDGRTRCLPSNTVPLASDVFGDPACTVPVAPRPQADCEPAFAVQVDDSSCPTRRRFFRLLGQRKSDVYAKNGAECSVAVGSSYWNYYDVSPEVPPAELMEITESTP